MKKNKIFFYALSFLEGASVMSAELLGAKMLSPFFGTSLYVWSSVLAITLGGLAAGYFAGGQLSDKKNNERNLYYILLTGSLFLMLMPFLAKEIMVHTAGMELVSSILFSSIVFLFPPVFFMGMVSPMIVECIVERTEKGEGAHSGKISGTVYAVSTVGGILATFFLGFYGIPQFGLTKPAIVSGALLGVIPFLKLLTMKRFISLLFPVIAFFSFNSSKPVSGSPDVKMLYSSEGLLGQILVADYPLYEGVVKKEGFQRILFMNRSTQTIVTYSGKDTSFFDYVNLISGRERSNHRPENALVLGLGGGSVATALSRMGVQVQAVELDERMADVAKKYFELPSNVRVIVDDARHFVVGRRSNATGIGKYDVVVLDAFVGEVNPHHLFTREFFKEIGSVLSDSGRFYINGNGYWAGETGRGMRSICKTLLSTGFDVEVISTQDNEDYRNLVFAAKVSSGSYGKISGVGIGSLNLDNAVVLTDEKPQLELLNASANKRWREACMKYFLRGYYSRQDMLLFE